MSDLSHKPTPNGFGGGSTASPFWAAHDAKLIAYAAQGKTINEAAELLGVSPYSAKGRSERLRLKWVNEAPLASELWVKLDPALIRLAEEGMSSRQVAEQLEVTRNAVIGRASRIGVTWQRKGYGGRGRRKVSDGKSERSWNFPPPGMCVYPLGHPKEPDFHFCSMPAEQGKPYCGSCMAKAYIPASKTSAKSEEWSEERKIAQALRSRAQFNTREAA
jgi:hypothetical protein